MLRRKAKLRTEGIVTDAFQDTSGVSKSKVKESGAHLSLTEEQQLEELVFGHQPFSAVSNFSNLTTRDCHVVYCRVIKNHHVVIVRVTVVTVSERLLQRNRKKIMLFGEMKTMTQLSVLPWIHCRFLNLIIIIGLISAKCHA